MLTEYDLLISKCIYRLDEMIKPFRSNFELCLENKDLIELPIEIIRIKDSDLIIWGQDVVGLIDTPNREDIVYSKELSMKWNRKERDRFPERYKEYEKNIENPSTGILIQSIIVNAMIDYYFITGKSCFSKKEIGKLMKQNAKNYIFQHLLDVCIVCRYNPEKISLQQERWLHEQYRIWRRKRSDKNIGDINYLTYL